ncbi:hypothetical protein AVM02_03250 [Brucella anthropi]
MRVGDIMTAPVIGIAPTASLADAARLMLGSRISGLPVVSADRHLVGVLTEGDFLRRIELGTLPRRAGWLDFFLSPRKEAAEYIHGHGHKVEEVMSPDPVTISSRAPVSELVDLMISRKIKRVLVVDDGTLVGIVARSDLMRAVLRMTPEQNPGAQDDDHIRTSIMEELKQHSWSGSVRVTVHGGIVEFHGIIFDDTVREAIRVAAENVPGVKNVVDHLLCIDPITGLYLSSPDDP